jgi:hypothetical protein
MVWRTPGADGGRDIQGEYFQCDLSGHIDVQKWYIECKRYAGSVDWPTVWNKIAYADNDKANFLLLVTTSNPSPNCESQIAQWNASRSRLLKVRIWRGYELMSYLNAFPVIGVKYGLSLPSKSTVSDFLDIGAEISKISQSSYAAFEFKTDLRPSLEAGSALAELLTYRMNDLATYGRFVPHVSSTINTLYDWVEVRTASRIGDEVVVRAVTATLRFVTGSQSIRIDMSDSGFATELIEMRRPLDLASSRLLSIVCLWSDIELRSTDSLTRLNVWDFSYR